MSLNLVLLFIVSVLFFFFECVSLSACSPVQVSQHWRSCPKKLQNTCSCFVNCSSKNSQQVFFLSTKKSALCSLFWTRENLILSWNLFKEPCFAWNNSRRNALIGCYKDNAGFWLGVLCTMPAPGPTDTGDLSLPEPGKYYCVADKRFN